jgi:hypothetical protein
MDWGEKILEEGADKLLKNKGLFSVRLYTKLGLRLAKTAHIGSKPGGMASPEFIGSATSVSFAFIAVVCDGASKVLVFINCEQFVPILVAGSYSSGIFSDRMAAYARNETFSLGDAAQSIFE